MGKKVLKAVLTAVLVVFIGFMIAVFITLVMKSGSYKSGTCPSIGKPGTICLHLHRRTLA